MEIVDTYNSTQENNSMKNDSVGEESFLDTKQEPYTNVKSYEPEYLVELANTVSEDYKNFNASNQNALQKAKDIQQEITESITLLDQRHINLINNAVKVERIDTESVTLKPKIDGQRSDNSAATEAAARQTGLNEKEIENLLE